MFYQNGGYLFNQITSFLAFTDAGSGFVFGYLVNQQPFNAMTAPNGSVTRDVITDINNFKSTNGVFYFKVLSVIYFFSFCVSMLFYMGAMQWLIGKIGWILQVPGRPRDLYYKILRSVKSTNYT